VKNSKDLTNGKVLVIGLDGATFDIINPLIEKDKLPNINILIKQGVCGNLISTIPPLSPNAWTTFATGKNAGKHGIYSFTEQKLNSYEIQFVNSLSRKAKPIWSILSKAGKKVGVINMPITYPPDKVNGFMISGMDTPGKECDFTYPKDLKKHILKKFDYEIDYSFLGSLNKYTGQKILDNLYKVEKKRIDVAKYLMNKYEWDFFFIVLVALDRVQHFFWHCMDEKHPRYYEEGAELFRNAIFEMYEKMDSLVGELIDDLEDSANIIIMSDHGAGPFDGSVPYLNLNDWLINHNYLRLKKERKTSVNKVRDVKINLLRYLRKFLREILPSKMRQKLKSTLPRLHEKFQSHLYFSSIDWTKTWAFASYDEFMARGIRINLKGREPQGIVDPLKEYEDLRDELVEKISCLKHPTTGEPIVKQVFRREELFNGPYLEKAPDLVVLWGESAFFSSVSQYGKRLHQKKEEFKLTNISRSGEHRLNGIHIISGPNIKKGKKIEKVSIIDLTPTILYLLGHPIIKDMDGKVLTQIFRESYLEKCPIQYKEAADEFPQEKKTYSEKEEKIIKERLKDLGYLEDE